MIIKKILNNNAVISYDSIGNDVIVIGRGISYNKKVGDRIKKEEIEQKYILERSGLSMEILQFVDTIPYDRLIVANKVANMIKGNYDKKLHNSFYLTLIDHISFTLERYDKNRITRNPLVWEIKKFYPKEFQLGLKAIELIMKETNLIIHEDEAATIAMHISYASINNESMMIAKILDIVESSLKIVQFSLMIEFDDSSLSYHRFITHLKFLAQRILLLKNPDQFENSNPLYETLRNQYREAYFCAEKILQSLSERYNFTISQDELVYLTIHLNRVLEDLKM